MSVRRGEERSAQQAVPRGAAEELRRLEAIVGAIADGITAQDVTGRLVYANDAAAQLVGVDSAEELLALPLEELLVRFELLDEQRRSLPLDELPGRVALRTGRSQERTVCYRMPETGEERWSVVRATPVRDEAGAVTLAINTFHDVTEQRRAGERVRFLEGASAVLASTLDLELTLARLGDVIVPSVADYCIIDLVEEGQPLRQAVLKHADPEKETLLRTHPAAVSTRRQPAAPGLAGARGRRASPDRARRRSGAERRGSRRAPPRSLSPPRAVLVRRRPADRSRPHARDARARYGRIGTALHGRRRALRGGGRQPDRARHRERDALHGCPVVVRAARHALDLRSGRDRLLGPRASLCPGQRRTCRDQRSVRGGSRWEVARRRQAGARAHARAAVSAGARDRRARRPQRVDGRGRPQVGRPAALAFELLPGARRGRWDHRRRCRDHGRHPPAEGRRALARARRGRRAVRLLARRRRRLCADRPGRRPAAGRLDQHLPGLRVVHWNVSPALMPIRSSNRYSRRCRLPTRFAPTRPPPSSQPSSAPSPCSSRTSRPGSTTSSRGSEPIGSSSIASARAR